MAQKVPDRDTLQAGGERLRGKWGRAAQEGCEDNGAEGRGVGGEDNAVAVGEQPRQGAPTQKRGGSAETATNIEYNMVQKEGERGDSGGYGTDASA